MYAAAMSREEPIARPASWEEMRDHLPRLTDAIRSSPAGARVELDLRGIERLARGLDGDLSD